MVAQGVNGDRIEAAPVGLRLHSPPLSRDLPQ
jgi:hypothetical protein